MSQKDYYLWGKKSSSQQIYELILGPTHLCLEGFGDWRNFVCCMPIWDIGSWGSTASCQRKRLLGITKCVGSWTFVTGNPSMWHLISLFWILIWSVVTLIEWQITKSLLRAEGGEVIWTALEFCKVWHSSAWGCVQHWCFLLKSFMNLSRGWDRWHNIGSKLSDLWPFSVMKKMKDTQKLISQCAIFPISDPRIAKGRGCVWGEGS